MVTLKKNSFIVQIRSNKSAGHVKIRCVETNNKNGFRKERKPFLLFQNLNYYSIPILKSQGFLWKA